MNDHIVCIMGEAGSGKTAVAKKLSDQGFNVIQSYTTRPPREHNEWGHIFVPLEDVIFDGHFAVSDYIGFGRYEGHYYWARPEQYRGKGTSIYVIEPDGVKRLKEEIWDAKITVIYIKTQAEARTTRLFKRVAPERAKYGSTWEDILKQIKRDKERFALIETDFCIDGNQSIAEVARLIVQAIKESAAGEDT